MRIRMIREHPLQCHDAPRVALPRTVNHTHSAASDFLQNLIIAEPPFLIRHIGLYEHVLENFGGCFDLGFEVFFEETTDAAAISKTARCPTLLAFCCAFRDASD